ncbi:MAG TPA: XdhC family protein [Steroidobacteraceae bacterium]|nr:XdhC family protein [Steroidobacteraceae bacterium]
MDSSLTALLAFLESRRPGRQPLVLATIVATAGSTYRKPGARMLIDSEGTACGLLSGGCLESDLREHARAVIANGNAQLVEYDLRATDDPIWGLGLGCEGSMSILLQRVSAADGYRPLDRIQELARLRQPSRFATVVRSTSSAWPAGSCLFEEDPVTEALGHALHQQLLSADGPGSPVGLSHVSADDAAISLFLGRVDPPPHVLILGGGPDAVPVVRAATDLGWHVSVYDHRPAYATSEHFAGAAQVIAAPTDQLASRVDLSRYEAVVVMSHHLPSDLDYLRQLASSAIRYIGLLGPHERRRRLAAELGSLAAGLEGRLRGPTGLDIGARTPEAIALAIVAEIHAVLAGRDGQPFSSLQNDRGPRT